MYDDTTLSNNDFSFKKVNITKGGIFYPMS